MVCVKPCMLASCGSLIKWASVTYFWHRRQNSVTGVSGESLAPEACAVQAPPNRRATHVIQPVDAQRRFPLRAGADDAGVGPEGSRGSTPHA